MTFLSTKPIPVRERLIFALDVSTRQEAEHWVEILGDSVLFYKLGLQCNAADLVLSRARRALALGCDGVISSGLEAPKLRQDLGPGFLVVVPGIRPVENRLVPDDQKRIVSVEEAFENGADYIVVGRPIRQAKDPRA